MSLLGRLAIVTGGASGIGKAVANTFIKEGAKVAVADIDISGFSVESPGKLKAYECDITKSHDVVDLFNCIKDDFSQTPCVAINAAGITRDCMMFKMSEKLFDEVINVNLKGSFLICQQAAKLMVNDKVQNGSIINISSIVGKAGNIGQTNYSASKAGIIGMTKTIARELGPKGIRCNAVLPGFIDTPMTKSVPDNIMNVVQMLTPLGRMGKPEEIAETCLFLASTKSSFITGATIEVTGGLNM